MIHLLLLRYCLMNYLNLCFLDLEFPQLPVLTCSKANFVNSDGLLRLSVRA
jgi:hypothetical protein